MIFDFDKVGDKKAIEVFPTINDFWEHLNEKIGIEPTFITQTTKGYHFSFHFKNHIFTHQKKPMKYLRTIKISITELVECDIHGSLRNSGIWRNPLRHKHYFSDSYNYELNDFRDLIIPKKSIQKKFNRDIMIRQISNDVLREGNRNNAIFYSSMGWARGKKDLSVEDIYYYALLVNSKCDSELEKQEIANIANSVHRYYINNEITISSSKSAKQREINEGAMNFVKMKGVSKYEYELEVKRRRQLSAQRTNEIVDIEQKKENMREVQKKQSEYTKSINKNKVSEAVDYLKKEELKITVSAVSRKSGLSRNTVRKYL